MIINVLSSFFTSVIRITFALRLMILLSWLCTKLATSDYACERVLDAWLQSGGGAFLPGGGSMLPRRQ